jgi:hypothetical protein
MPFVIHRVDSIRRFVAVATGHVTIEEATRDMATVRTGELQRYGVMIDLTLADMPVSFDQIHQLVDYAKRLTAASGPRGPVAIVAPHSKENGMWRLLGALAEQAAVQQRIAAFRSVESAEEWLDQSILPPGGRI